MPLDLRPTRADSTLVADPTALAGEQFLGSCVMVHIPCVPSPPSVRTPSGSSTVSVRGGASGELDSSLGTFPYDDLDLEVDVFEVITRSALDAGLAPQASSVMPRPTSCRRGRCSTTLARGSKRGSLLPMTRGQTTLPRPPLRYPSRRCRHPACRRGLGCPGGAVGPRARGRWPPGHRPADGHYGCGYAARRSPTPSVIIPSVRLTPPR